MAEKSTVARPYAEAVFSQAQDDGQLKEWSEMLQLIRSVAVDPAMASIISNASVNKQQLADLFLEIIKDHCSDKGQNLIKVLAENRRLGLLPEIVEQFEQLRAEAEKTIDAQVISAFKVSKAQETAITKKLKQRLGREVTLTCTVDESLLGGVVIKAGDMVIDGSVVGQLNKLAVKLAG
jgi:F-type H+-transporting ATPase subunit delta